MLATSIQRSSRSAHGRRSRRGRTLGRDAALLAACLGAIFACGGETAHLTFCEPDRGITPICGFRNPEDLVALPGDEWLIASQFRSTEGPAGSLVALRVADEKRLRLYPKLAAGTPFGAESAAPGWGAPDCPGPPDPAAFAPHGIDLARRRLRPPCPAAASSPRRC